MREIPEMGGGRQGVAPIKPIVQATAVRKTYRLQGTLVEALRGVDFTAYPGEFVAIIGPSGCGKSTLLNVLGGLDDPTSGEVIIDGQRLRGLDEKARALLRRTTIGYVFQSYDLLPLLTARQNVEFPLAVTGMAPERRRVRALELLEQMGLADKQDALPDLLSGGQQQRIALARTLASAPLVIFADEPTGSLDSLTGAEIIALLRRAVAEYGATIIMVTHDAEDAGKADRIVQLRDGIVVDGTVNGMVVREAAQ
jgi:ABC-type lipoprotein export system ATPase subunit